MFLVQLLQLWLNDITVYMYNALDMHYKHNSNFKFGKLCAN